MSKAIFIAQAEALEEASREGLGLMALMNKSMALRAQAAPAPAGRIKELEAQLAEAVRLLDLAQSFTSGKIFDAISEFKEKVKP